MARARAAVVPLRALLARALRRDAGGAAVVTGRRALDGGPLGIRGNYLARHASSSTPWRSDGASAAPRPRAAHASSPDSGVGGVLVATLEPFGANAAPHDSSASSAANSAANSADAAALDGAAAPAAAPQPADAGAVRDLDAVSAREAGESASASAAEASAAEAEAAAHGDSVSRAMRGVDLGADVPLFSHRVAKAESGGARAEGAGAEAEGDAIAAGLRRPADAGEAAADADAAAEAARPRRRRGRQSKAEAEEGAAAEGAAAEGAAGEGAPGGAPPRGSAPRPQSQLSRLVDAMKEGHPAPHHRPKLRREASVLETMNWHSRFMDGSPEGEALRRSWRRQVALETRAVELAAARYRRDAESAVSRGQGAALPVSRRLLLRWFEPLVEAVRHEQEQITARVPGMDRSVYGPYLLLLSPEQLSVIAMHTTLNMVMDADDRGAVGTNLKGMAGGDDGGGARAAAGGAGGTHAGAPADAAGGSVAADGSFLSAAPASPSPASGPLSRPGGAVPGAVRMTRLSMAVGRAVESQVQLERLQALCSRVNRANRRVAKLRAEGAELRAALLRDGSLTEAGWARWREVGAELADAGEVMPHDPLSWFAPTEGVESRLSRLSVPAIMRVGDVARGSQGTLAQIRKVTSDDASLGEAWRLDVVAKVGAALIKLFLDTATVDVSRSRAGSGHALPALQAYHDAQRAARERREAEEAAKEAHGGLEGAAAAGAAGGAPPAAPPGLGAVSFVEVTEGAPGGANGAAGGALGIANGTGEGAATASAGGSSGPAPEGSSSLAAFPGERLEATSGGAGRLPSGAEDAQLVGSAAQASGPGPRRGGSAVEGPLAAEGRPSASFSPSPSSSYLSGGTLLSPEESLSLQGGSPLPPPPTPAPISPPKKGKKGRRGAGVGPEGGPAGPDPALRALLAIEARDAERGRSTERAFWHALELLPDPHRRSRWKKYGLVFAHEEVARRVRPGEMAEAFVPVYTPMVIPPVPWQRADVGGHLTLRCNVMRTRGSHLQMRRLKAADAERDEGRGAGLSRVYAALNALGSTPWSIHRGVLSVVEALWEGGGGVAGLPARADFPIPPPVRAGFALRRVGESLALFDPGREAERRSRAARKRLRRKNAELHSLRCDSEHKLAVAREFKDEPAFYYPHNVDFRGRAYPMHPHLNHLGADLCRGMLTFAEAKPLGPKGLDWLCVQAANLWGGGVDKLPHAERVAWARDNVERLRRNARDPLLLGRDWLEELDPQQRRAFELQELTQSRGGARGGAGGGSGAGAGAGALEAEPGAPDASAPPPPSFPPQSPMSPSATEAVRRAARVARALPGSALAWTEADAPFQFLAVCMEMDKALASGDPASYLSALPVHMDGSCNGLQHYAALGRDDDGGRAVNLVDASRPQDVYTRIAERVRAKVERDAEAGVVHAKALLEATTVDRKLVKQTVMTSVYGVTFVGARAQIGSRLRERGLADTPALYKVSCYAASITLGALHEMFAGAKDIMRWLAECARAVAKTGDTVGWTTPLGLPVVQPYRRLEKHHVRTLLQRLIIVDNNDNLPVMKQRQRTAFPPNFIHSIDSTHMMMTAAKCAKEGLSFAGVHDSYWTHAGDIDRMNQVLREQFVALHSQPLLENLLEELQEAHPDVEFPPVPARGNLDLNLVKQSTYFFS